MPRDYLDPNRQFFVGSDDTPTATMPTGQTSPAPQQPTPPVTAPISLTVPQATPAPDLPQPTATDQHETYLNTEAASLESSRKALEDRYKSELENIRSQQELTQANMDRLADKEQGVIEGPVKQNLAPFRAEMERSNRAKFQVEENYQANQKLVNELDGLLTAGNEMMKKLRDTKVPGLAGLQQAPSMINALNNVAARTGVINAVMAARNNQISVAENMIDRSVSAVNADRKDQLNYYNTLLNFFDKQRDEEGNKLVNLNKQETGFINAQIGLLENDLQRSQESADYIKKLMIDPTTAKFMAESGVTLNDSVETIKTKMAAQASIEEQREEAKVNKQELFDAGIKTPFAIKNGEIIRVADGWGFKDQQEFRDMTGMTVEDAKSKGLISEYSTDVLAAKKQVLALMDKYWDTGIQPGDDIGTATAKAMRSAVYQKAVRVGGGSGGGGSSRSTNKKLDATTNLFASNIQQALLAGRSPEDAVAAVVQYADQQLNTSLSIEEQSALYDYAKSIQGSITPTGSDENKAEEPPDAVGGNPIGLTDVAREIPGAVFKGVKAEFNAVKAAKKGYDDIVEGIGQGIADLFK